MKNRGQSMFELIVAVFVVGLTLTAIVTLVTNAISNSTFSKERTQAAKYTNEAVEWLREQRDLDWGQFKGRASGSGTTHCLPNLNWGQSCTIIAGTVFTRTAVLILAPSGESVEARVVTSWSDQSGQHESRVTTSLTNWRTK